MTVSTRGLFQPAAFLTKWARRALVALLSRGQAICSQGDAGKEVFYIEKGQVKVTVSPKRGKETVLAILHRGNYLGAGCMTGQAFLHGDRYGNYTMYDPGHWKEGDDARSPQWA